MAIGCREVTSRIFHGKKKKKWRKPPYLLPLSYGFNMQHTCLPFWVLTYLFLFVHFIWIFFISGSFCVALSSFNLVILLPLPLEYPTNT